MLSLLFFLLPSLSFQPSTSSSPRNVQKQRTQKKINEKKYRGMKIVKQRKREGHFFHPFNNGGMISAYPLITSLLYSFAPSSVISHTP